MKLTSDVHILFFNYCNSLFRIRIWNDSQLWEKSWIFAQQILNFDKGSTWFFTSSPRFFIFTFLACWLADKTTNRYDLSSNRYGGKYTIQKMSCTLHRYHTNRHNPFPWKEDCLWSYSQTITHFVSFNFNFNYSFCFFQFKFNFR